MGCGRTAVHGGELRSDWNIRPPHKERPQMADLTTQARGGT